MSTIYDIATHTGLSPSTVARALRGKGYCSAKSRKLVEVAAVELGYAPMQAAKVLNTKQTNMLIICTPNPYNSFFQNFLKGVDEVLDSYGYHSIICGSRGHAESELQMIENLRQHYADGLIIFSNDVTPTLIDRIRSSGRPTVLASWYPDHSYDDCFDSVLTDVQRGIVMVTDYLIGLGHTDIAYAGRPLEESSGYIRHKGFVSAMTKAGISISENRVIFCNMHEDTGEALARDWQRNDNIPTALVCAADSLAVGFINQCEQLGIAVPEHISVVGVDNGQLTIRTRPHFASVDLMQEQLGQKSAELIMERIMGLRSEAQHIKLLPKLILRDSTTCPRK